MNDRGSIQRVFSHYMLDKKQAPLKSEGLVGVLKSHKNLSFKLGVCPSNNKFSMNLLPTRLLCHNDKYNIKNEEEYKKLFEDEYYSKLNGSYLEQQVEYANNVELNGYEVQHIIDKVTNALNELHIDDLVEYEDMFQKLYSIEWENLYIKKLDMFEKFRFEKFTLNE